MIPTTNTCCVQCGTRSNDPLYKEYGQRSHSGNIRLTRCQVCDERLDKYLEYDPVLIIIDLILHKIEVYRHLLFNSSVFVPNATTILSNVSFVFIGMVCFDAYIKRHNESISIPGSRPGLLQVCPITMNPDPTPIPNSIPIPTTMLSTDGIVVADVSDLGFGLKGGCFNTSTEDAIIERFVDGIKNTHFWLQSISLFLLALAENVCYIGAIVLSIRLWESICPLNNTSVTSSAISNATTAAFSSTNTNQTMQPKQQTSHNPIKSNTSSVATSSFINTNSRSNNQNKNKKNDTTTTSTHNKTTKSNNNTNYKDKDKDRRLRRARSDSMDYSNVSVSTTMIVYAIILSSWGKLLLLLLMVWEYSDDMIHVVNFVVVASNFTAIHSLLSIGRWPPRVVSLFLVLFPFGVRTLFQMSLAHMFGNTVMYSTEWTPW